jgi:abortive infection bacteriophage resistance protein
LFLGAEMKFSKPAKTHEEQLTLLRARGLTVRDPDRALHYLRHLNYYRLTAYWLPFRDQESPRCFRQGTDFEDVLSLYVFDREFRLLPLDAIERVEVSFRTAWAYYMAHRYGPHSHLDAGLAKHVAWHVKNLASLEKEISRSDELFIEHYRQAYHHPEMPPIWAVCEVMSLGVLSRWVNQLPSGDLGRIAANYGLDQSVMRSFLQHLTYVRNVCAHHSRVWNRRLTITMKVPNRKPAAAAAVANTAAAPRNIYNTLVMLAYLLDIISPEHQWRKRLGKLLMDHDIDTRQMGFPDDWKKQPFWAEAAHAQDMRKEGEL